ncbi:polysaccharide pyruvyl transferase family protein [Amnibacterium sp.]|uniref:polysaccharide pyruvyl transferase family protein n=1 Tax=Amnibacterium sp. TaxID=1872496 RepID=UPI00262A5DF0|nr:polysaccharide pyruvyl transferase family protein [Amnibacterium sp.]MCU1473138.1 hypothetical protein [Amnibacterium sp.]
MSRRPRPLKIFVPSRGQYDNVGDIILRRQLLTWLRPLGTLHTYVGQAPAGYAEGLELAPQDVRYASFAAWYRAALFAALTGRAVYAFKPGEIQLTMAGMKEHLSVLPLVALCRLRGGRVVRVGSGSRNFAPLPRLLMAPSVAASQFTAWRDADTAAYIGRGSVMPDLAFGEGSPAEALERGTRDRLVVSLRSDRPMPADAWFAGLREYADRAGLGITVISQVTRDRQRSAEVAARLHAELFDWDGTDPAAHEAALRRLYARTLLVVSDRLHVLIAALTEGAAPSAAVRGGSEKIERHFAAAGFTGVSAAVEGLKAPAIAALLEQAVQQRPATLAALAAARAELQEVREAMVEVVAGEQPALAGATV